MKLALMQMDIAWEDKEKNLKKAEKLLETAVGHECSIAVFPEMFSTGFSMNAEGIAETENGSVLSTLRQLANRYGIALIAGIAVESEDSYENRAYIIDSDGKVLDFYTKNYGFSYSGEDKIYRSDDKQIVFEVEDIKASVFICYDLRFPELFRKVAKSISVVFVIANWPDSRIGQWDALLKARAIENQCFVVAVNRKGIDGNGLNYNGHSAVYSPSGEEIDLFRLDGECRCFEIDEGEAAFVRQRFPFLKDLK
jgi:predicted amidohydrolase